MSGTFTDIMLLKRLTRTYPYRSLGIVCVKGKRQAVPIFEILARTDPLDDLKLQTRDMLEEALKQYTETI